jgi:hypothetical protein
MGPSLRGHTAGDAGVRVRDVSVVSNFPNERVFGPVDSDVPVPASIRTFGGYPFLFVSLLSVGNFKFDVRVEHGPRVPQGKALKPVSLGGSTSGRLWDVCQVCCPRSFRGHRFQLIPHHPRRVLQHPSEGEAVRGPVKQAPLVSSLIVLNYRTDTGQENHKTGYSLALIIRMVY